jgi:hypothetical protein
VPGLIVHIPSGSRLPALAGGSVEPGPRRRLDGHVALSNPKRLMLGHLIGALMTSMTLGLVIVFALNGSSAVSADQNTISPAVHLALGTIALVAAGVLGTGRDVRATAPRRTRARRDGSRH